MDKKLTLSLNESVIEDAKLFAKRNKTSLSKMIENYLKSVVHIEPKIEITPLVKSLSGIVELPADIDVRDEYTNHLIEKYR